MYVLDTKEQSVRDQKVTRSALKICSKLVCTLILTERAIKNEPKEIYSTVPKGHKWKSKLFLVHLVQYSTSKCIPCRQKSDKFLFW